MKSVIIIVIALVLVIPVNAFSQETNNPRHFGEVQWVEPIYDAPGTANFQIIEPDQNTDPNKIDSFSVNVYSDTDKSGINYVVIETGNNSGIFGGLISLSTVESSSGHTLRVSSGDTMVVSYVDTTLAEPYTAKDSLNITAAALVRAESIISSITVDLDQSKYTWTDKVSIKVTSQIHNKDPNAKDIIGDEEHENVIVSTKLKKLSNYRLVETSSNSGIFEGIVTLTGFSNHDANGDGIKNDASGETSGSGPTNGKISSQSHDGISVSVEYDNGKYEFGSAVIYLNIGESFWLQKEYKGTDQGWFHIVDPDMNFNPNSNDSFFVSVFQNYKASTTGITVKAVETGKNSGIFEGNVNFVTGQSYENNLHANMGDTIVVQYRDRTLSDPYSLDDTLDITGTTILGSSPVTKQAPIQSNTVPESTCSSDSELVNGICTKIQTLSSSEFSTSDLGGSSSSANQNQNFGSKSTVKSLTYHEQYGDYIDGFGEFSIIFDYDLDFRIEHPEKIEAGTVSEFTITPIGGILTSTLTLAGNTLQPEITSIGLGDTDGFSYAVVKVDTQPSLNVSPYVNGPASTSSSNISMNSMNSKTIRLTADNNIGNSNSITVNLPVTLYLNAALKFTLFDLPFLPDIPIEQLPLAKKMTPQISETIPLIKYHKTKLTLDVEKSSKDQYVKIKPNLKLDSGQILSKSVSIEVNGIPKKSLQANQWSNDFYLGYGQHNIQAVFNETTDNSNNANVYRGSSSSVVKTTLMESLKSETSVQASSQSNLQSVKSGLTCGSGTHEDNGQCVADSIFGGGCLIATATYGSELAPQVQKLRELRDNSLLSTESGTRFMNTFNDVYYSFSPIIADYERENPVFRDMVKVAITPMITSLSILNYVDMDSESEVLGYGISLIVLNGMMYVGIPVLAVTRFRK
jgi:hypothetical protein